MKTAHCRFQNSLTFLFTSINGVHISIKDALKIIKSSQLLCPLTHILILCDEKNLTSTILVIFKYRIHYY